MNVGASTSSVYANYIASSTQDSASQSPSAAGSSAATSFLGDSVEISDAARNLLAAEKGEVKDIAKKPSISSERVDEIREKMQAVLSKKKRLDSKLKNVLSSMRIDENLQKDLKIEVDSKGKVVVGGIEDTALARKIEKELNKDKDFANEFKSYAKIEQDLSVELRKETGMSLKDFTRVNLSQGIYAERQGLTDESGETGMTGFDVDRDAPQDEVTKMLDRAKLAMGSDLFLAEPGLMDMALEIASFSGANFSSETQGVADPKSALTSLLNNAKTDIQAQFDLYNKKVAPKGATSPEQEYARQLSLNNVEIGITADGNISIKGNFASDATANADAEAMVREILEKMIHEDEAFGMESVFTTASRQMLANHKDEFSAENDGAVRAILKNGVADAYIHSEGAVMAAKGGIQGEAAAYLQSKLDAEVGEDDLEVSDTGRITLSAAYQGDQADRIRVALNGFNNRIADLLYKKPDSIDDSVEDDTRAKNVAKFIKEMAAYRPGGLTGRYGYGAEFAEE